ncbi:MAG: hypothetical protein ACE5EX_10820 [Phycisphaerae bacterium]
MNTTTVKRDQQIAAIARTILDIPALETRKSDRLEFHNVSVWGLKAAYQAGRDAARQPTRGA